MALDRILHGGLPRRSYEEAWRDSYAARRAIRQRADRQHLRLMARNTVIDIKGWRHDFAGLDTTWPDCQAGVRRLRQDQQGARLRYLRELRSQHSALIRLRREAE